MTNIVNNNLIQSINEAQGIVANASILLQSCGEEKDKKIILKEVAIRINSLFGKNIKVDPLSKDLSVQELAIKYVEQYPILHPFFSELLPKIPFPTSAKILGRDVPKEEAEFFSKIYTVKISQHLSRIKNALNDDVSKGSINFIENQLRFIPVIFKAFPELVEDAFKSLCVIYTNSNVEKKSILVRLISNEISSHLNPNEKQFCFSILEKQNSIFFKDLHRAVFFKDLHGTVAAINKRSASTDLQSYAALPEDILDAAFSYLSIGDIFECLFVCKIWNQVIQPQTTGFLWKKLVKRDYEVLCLGKELRSNQECFLFYHGKHILHSNLRRGRYTLDAIGSHNAGVELLACSPNGTTLASYSCDRDSYSYDREIRIWEMTKEEKKYKQAFSAIVHSIESLVFNSDGTKLYACYNKQVKIWDIATGVCLDVFDGYDREISYSFAFSPDGGKLCCGLDNGMIRVCDMATGLWSDLIDLDTVEIEGRKRGHDSSVADLVFSPDGSLLCSTAAHEDTIKIWDIETKQRIRIFPVEVKGTIAFSPNGKVVCVRSSKGIQFLDIEKGLRLGKTGSSTRSTDLFVFSPNGKMLCARSNPHLPAPMFPALMGQPSFSDLPGSDHRKDVIALWDLTTGKFLMALEGHGSSKVKSFAFNPDGSLLCAGFDDGIRIWDTMTGRLLHIFADTKCRGASFLNFSPNGRALYFITPCGPSLLGKSSDEIWNAVVVKALNFDVDSAQILSNSADLFLKNTEESRTEAMRLFETLSLQKKNGVYENLSDIYNPLEIFRLHVGKALFYGRSTAQEKAKAIELYLNESKVETVQNETQTIEIYPNASSRELMNTEDDSLD